MSDERHESGWLHKMHGEDERRSVSYAGVIVAIAALGALGGFGVLAMTAGAQKQRLDTIEIRQMEDRGKVERIDLNVQIILRELRAMQVERDVERRNTK